ncbi:MAG: MBL fold metallo-hydrolase [bacterium]
MKTAKYLVLFCLLFFLLLFESVKNAGAHANARSGPAISAADSLTYLGHATVKIRTLEGKIIYIDPFQPGDYSDSADVVLITHQHSDHNRLNLVKQRAGATVISNFEAIQNNAYQSFTIGNVKVDAVPAYNANHQRSACVGYVVELNGIKLYHAGDTGLINEMADLAARELTYALLPIDGVFTMSPEQATQAASMIQAKFNVPMHTMPTPDTYNDANVARFTPANKVIVRPGQTIALSQEVSAVGERSAPPGKFTLGQNYPNPFNPSTRIAYTLATEGNVSLKVYDVNGAERAELVNGRRNAGDHVVTFDAKNLPSGVYFYRIQMGPFAETRKCILMK